MCESNRILEQRNYRLEQGRARERLLQQWIADDDASLTTTLRLWRDDVVSRLQASRPAICRLPQCIAERLGIDRRVLIDANNAVWSYPKGQPKNRLLVPGT